MKCQHSDYFDDMYPEFAPEPIRIQCENTAVRLVIVAGDYGEGREVWQWATCEDHDEQDKLLAEDPYQTGKILLRLKVG